MTVGSNDSYCWMPAKDVLVKSSELFNQITKERSDRKRNLFNQFKEWQRIRCASSLLNFLESIGLANMDLERENFSIEAWLKWVEEMPPCKPSQKVQVWKQHYISTVITHRMMEYGSMWRLYKLALMSVQSNPESVLLLSGVDAHFLTTDMNPNDFNEYTARDETAQ